MVNVNNGKVFDRLREHLTFYHDNFDNEWVGIFLYGSQNYGLATEESDVDTRIVVLPTLDDVLMGNQGISKTLTLPNGEHIEVKDIRLMFDMLRKQDVCSLEILFTKYRILNSKYENNLQRIFDKAEMIAHYDNYRCASSLLGMIFENRKRFGKPDEWHEYDGKALAHMDRMHEFIKRFLVDGEPFEDCLQSKKKELLLAAKAHRYTYDCALTTANTIVDDAKAMVEQYRKNTPHVKDYFVDYLLDNTVYEIIGKYVYEELNFAKTKGWL